jgi:hypothetical protein
MIEPNEKGLIICPNCLKEYKPVLTRKDNNEPIQITYPNSKPFEREQLISGLCSDKCWNEFLGIPTRKSVVIEKKQQQQQKVFKGNNLKINNLNSKTFKPTIK